MIFHELISNIASRLLFLFFITMTMHKNTTCERNKETFFVGGYCSKRGDIFCEKTLRSVSHTMLSIRR